MYIHLFHCTVFISSEKGFYHQNNLKGYKIILKTLVNRINYFKLQSKMSIAKLIIIKKIYIIPPSQYAISILYYIVLLYHSNVLPKLAGII
jgi:hypothetical protein